LIADLEQALAQVQVAKKLTAAVSIPDELEVAR
jgi:hypothetical protein